jgi:hypothetical protein
MKGILDLYIYIYKKVNFSLYEIREKGNYYIFSLLSNLQPNPTSVFELLNS